MKDSAIRLFDILVSGLLILALLPLLVLITLLVIICIGFPPFYLSRRVGKGGIEYTHFKFRSMLPGEATGRIFFEQERLNGFGRILRRLHLDELPELLNIFCGHSSFVGPRPLPRELLAGLETGLRETVPPGWTGPAQIQLLRNGSLDKYLQIELDNQYVKGRGLLHNLELIIQTIYWLPLAKRPDLDSDSSEDRRKFKRKLDRRGS